MDLRSIVTANFIVPLDRGWSCERVADEYENLLNLMGKKGAVLSSEAKCNPWRH